MSTNESSLEGLFTMQSGGNALPDNPPFHLLIIGDWSGKAERANLEKRRPIEIDRDNFDDVIRKIRPQVSLDFDQGNSLTLSFTELDDFHPDNIFRQIPLFENLRDIRKRLKNHDTFNEAAREVRSWFVHNEPVLNVEKIDEVVEADNLLDAILGGKSVDASAVKRQTSSSDLNDFIGNIIKPHIIQTDLAEQENLTRAVDEVISDLMRKILHHKDFLSLESAWRGLYFLTRRIETDTELKIYLLDITKNELSANLKSVSSLADSFYYQWTIGESLETSLGEPWAVVCGNYDFSPNVDDVAALMRISQISQIANTPFISHIRPDVLGVNSLFEKPSSSNWHLSEESNEWKLWTTLRNQKEAVYIGMAMPRFLARLPYGYDTEPTEVFAFEEFTDDIEHNNYVWINPSFACGFLLAKSFRKNGWEMAENIAREIEGLPMHVYQQNGETQIKPCAEIPMTEAGCQKMIDNGIMPLVSFKDTDKIRVGSFQSIAVSQERIRGRWY